ncbi:MAG: molybdopterin-binding protein [Deltaproteobacteria bacterium]|nr:MAG: molybdopterin-binding protein [Deltaproteobacteria bacterium]
MESKAEKRPVGATTARILPVEEAVGTVLAHDITEIRPGQFKGVAFKKGHVVRPEDVEHLKRLGKNHLYVLELGPGQLHEDVAAERLARAIAGDGVDTAGPPAEGKIKFLAARKGLLKVNVDALYRINLLGEVMCSCKHTNMVVEKGDALGGTRAIPLVIEAKIVERAEEICSRAGGILSVLPLRSVRAGVVITGTEVVERRVKDVFGPIMSGKLERLGSTVIDICHAHDDIDEIQSKLENLLERGAELIIATGGMSVDPDDVTRHAIRRLGVREFHYGSPVLPGAMFLVAYLERDGIPVLGVPACGMYSSTTVLDLVLPRILAGEHIGREELAALGHGGYCYKCDPCRFPVCPFGK